MPKLRWLRTSACAALIGTLAAPTTALTPRPATGDGTVSVEACRELGFDITRRQVDRYAQQRMAAPSPTYAPPPPPPPPPPVEIQGVTVTGSRTVRQDFESVAPVTTTGRSGPTIPHGPPPGSVETERYPDATVNPVKRVAEQPVSTFSIDVDTASYANVRRFLNEGRLPPRDAVRVEELINYFNYDYPLPESRNEPFRPFVAVTPSPWNQGKRIVHVALQGYDIPRAEQPPLNLVFLVDVSGSMQGPDRLQLAQQSLNVLIDRLRPEDRISLAVYAGAAGAVLEPTSGREKLKLRCAVESLEAGGSTAGGAGLELAYGLAQRHFRRDAVNRVILMTDGDFNVGVSDPEKLEDFVAEKRRSGVYLSVYGFGRGNYNDTLMQALAQTGNGTAAYVDSLREGRKIFHDDFESGLFPIADDVKIQVEFNPAQVSEWRLVGYETRLLNREDFNNDRVDAGEVGSGAAVTALYEITPAGEPGSVDPLRYQAERPPAGRSGEIAFLRVRYKLPGEASSRLMERAIGEADAMRSLDAAPASTRWAIAVASWGQKLRGDPWISDEVSWAEVERLATVNERNDALGLRAEFVDLARRTGEVGPAATAGR